MKIEKKKARKKICKTNLLSTLYCWITKKKKASNRLSTTSVLRILNFLIKSGVGQTSQERKKLKRPEKKEKVAVWWGKKEKK